jgi:hypothetical protein
LLSQNSQYPKGDHAIENALEPETQHQINWDRNHQDRVKIEVKPESIHGFTSTLMADALRSQ